MKAIGYGNSTWMQLGEKWVSNAHWAFDREYFEKHFKFKSKRLQKFLKEGKIANFIKGKPYIKRKIEGLIFSDVPSFSKNRLEYKDRDVNNCDVWSCLYGIVRTSPTYYPYIKDLTLHFTKEDGPIKLYDDGDFIGLIHIILGE